MTNPEKSGINPLEFPIEYFDAQVHFAQKWSEISGEELASTLLTKTALYRRIVGSPAPEDTLSLSEDWRTLVSGIEQPSDAQAVTATLYDAYSNNPANKYTAPRTQSAFGYDYLPDSRTVKIHFTNPTRGERPLSDENMDKRRQDFRAVLEDVRQQHPEAALLMSATWLRSTSRYRSLSPPDIDEQQSMMSTDMKFGGNSVWGQFMDASGNANQQAYGQFITSLAQASTLDELVAAFPYKTLRAVDPIDKYYSYYGVENTATLDSK